MAVTLVAACNPSRTEGLLIHGDVGDGQPADTSAPTDGDIESDTWSAASDASHSEDIDDGRDTHLDASTDAETTAESDARDTDGALTDTRPEDADATTDSWQADVGASDVDEPEVPVRPPTCSASEFPEFRTPPVIEATTDQLVWTRIEVDVAPTLLSRHDGQLHAYDAETRTRALVRSEQLIAGIAAAGNVPTLGTFMVAQVEPEGVYQLFRLRRVDGELELTPTDTPLSIASGEAFEFHTDGTLVARSGGALRLFSFDEAGVSEAVCTSPPGVGPLLIDSDGDAIYSFLPVNALGDVAFARWPLADCDAMPQQGNITFNGANPAVLLSRERGSVAVSLDRTFSVTTFDGSDSTTVSLDRTVRPSTGTAYSELTAVRQRDARHDELLLNGSLLIDVLGGGEVRWLTGGLPAVGTSSVAFSVASTASGLIWRERDWELAGEPVPLPKIAEHTSWLSQPAGRTFLVRERAVDGFTSGATLTVSATPTGRQRGLETRTFSAGGAFLYNDIRWASGDDRLGLASGGDLVWLSDAGVPQLAPSDLSADEPLFLRGAWLGQVRQGEVSEGIFPTTNVSAGTPEPELPIGMQWRRTDAEGGVSNFRGTLAPAISELYFLGDALGHQTYVLYRQSGSLRLREVHDAGFAEVTGADVLAEMEEADVRVLGQPRSGEILVVRNTLVEVFRIERGELLRRSQYESPGPLTILSDNGYNRYGVVLADEAHDAWLWSSSADAPRRLGISDIATGSVGDMDQDGVLDVVVRHRGAIDESLYYGDCW